MPLKPLLTRIADALDRLSPPSPPLTDLGTGDGFLWDQGRLQPVARIAAQPLDDLRGIDLQKRTLFDNTRHFAAGRTANNALLWGARGMGKSSLVKAVHQAVLAAHPGRLKLIDIARDDLPSLPALLRQLRQTPHRCLVFCDDLSFEASDAAYKALKSVLEGGIEGRPANVLFYATSNRRHLMPRDMIENEQARAIHQNEAAEEKISLSDRFGLWLGFHACDQSLFLEMVFHYAHTRGLAIGDDELRTRALAWATARGSRSGRVASQFIDDAAASLPHKNA